MDACPKCGGDSGVQTNDRANGWITRLVWWNGVTDHTDMDKLREIIPKTGTCIDCGKRVPNPQYGRQ